ncbi:lysophospholipid acyltransferase family protein [Pseudogemmobacter sonorensis]|uniref:lysophospholipid acyltransferase family protein n=1 Tax=Pseudogemmobacter sonorensis TaxID=2989681 RepID=UPI00369ABDFF
MTDMTATMGGSMTGTEAFTIAGLALGDVVPDLPDFADLRLPPVFTYSHPGQSAFRRRMIRLAELAFGSARLERIYRDWRRMPRDPSASVFTEAMRILEIETEYAEGSAARIPATGGVLVVANHPFGIADGLAIGDLVARMRPDVKLMVHSLLCRPVEARDVLLPVDFSGAAGARRTSAMTRRAAVAWLEAGHVLVIFPAGGVATAPRPLARRAADPAWHPFVARLAASKGVRVVPVFVHGQNSRLFQMASHFSYPLRVALLFRETLRRRRGKVRLSVGEPVSLAPGRGMAEDARPAAGEGADRIGTRAMAGGAVEQLRRMTFAMAPRRGPRASDEFRYPDRLKW